LVHFDIEWNPAKMEQREGRTDRLGRILQEPVNIYYVLVRRTYDERMLEQLIARQRWHSVLLGKPAARLARDERGNIKARFLRVEEARKSTLNLAPRNRKS
jgi:SNF2 family DNA or RNA helicase